MIIKTWDNDGLKLTVTVPLGIDAVTGDAYPASTLAGATLRAFLGDISASGTVSGVVAASSVTSTETATQAKITALWAPTPVILGIHRAQVIVTIPGDKPYTVFDADVNVLPSLG